MSKEAVESRIFIDGAARFHDLLYILSKDKKLAKKEVSHTSAISIDEGEWANVINVKWDSTALAVARQPEEKLVFIGEDGQVCTYVGGKSGKESLKPKPLLIRRAKAIDGHVYACGMGREVYKRTGENQWIQINALAPKEEERTGFEAIDGFSESELYAVGWRGEIWHFDGSVWAAYPGITNLVLTSVCCAGDGFVYVVGQRGLFIKGRHDAWEVVDFDNDFSSDFWDVHWFNDKLYLTTMTGLYVFENGALNEVDVDDMLNTSFYRLASAEGVLWSIGSSDILSFDGKQWHRYT